MKAGSWLFLLVAVSGCSGSGSSLQRLLPGTDAGTEGPGFGDASPTAGGSSGAPTGQGISPTAGTLTAGEWDDNLNFALYSSYAAAQRQNDTSLPTLQPTQVARHARNSPASLDLAFVLDTTGSMGDELAYLVAEVGSIVDRVKAVHPNVSLRLGLVLYRDLQDEYVTRSFDFTDKVADFQSNLSAQGSSGGGDYPEAMERGFAAAQQLSWRGGDTVQVLFHIADAPPHAESYGLLLQEAQAAAQQGIVQFPVSASGVDDALEYLMRAMAQVSGGRYLFLTNDSGVGDNHQAPTVPCYQVRKLNTLMVERILDEMGGTSSAPDPNDIVRTVGQVTGNTCALDGNQTATLY